MDLAIEANRNSALHNTMQQVLDVYNPLLHKARPVVVNQTKHRIRVSPTIFANTFDAWNGQRSVRFDLPRIGSLVDFTLKCAFRIPGVNPSSDQIKKFGYRGYADPLLKTGGVTDNTDAATNNGRGRLDRVYADRLLGFNMIRSYTVSSKSRQIFQATGEYLLVRFAQMDADMKEAVMKSVTPVDIMAPGCDDMFYAPATTYTMSIPLFMFFNEHITSALDVNFSEEVHVDIQLRSPSELFYYGQLGDMGIIPLQAAALGQYQLYTGGSPGLLCWDQASSVGITNTDLDGADGQISLMQTLTANHIRGIGAPFANPGAGYGAVLGASTSGPTFAFPDVDNLGKSCTIQFEGNADYIVQDTDAYRALRAQQFPEGTGLTTIVYDTSQEQFSKFFTKGELLDKRSGGTLEDPALSQSGITVGNSQAFVDIALRDNHLCFATHFMVRKHSDMGGSSNTQAGLDATKRIGPESDSKRRRGSSDLYSVSSCSLFSIVVCRSSLV